MHTLLGFFFVFQAEDGIRVRNVTGVQTCALPIFGNADSWDLTALGLPPSERANLAVCHFTDFPQDWNYLVRSFLMVLINPMDEKLLEAGLHRPEKIPKLKSLRHYFYALRKIEEWATTHHKTADLTTWARVDLDD